MEVANGVPMTLILLVPLSVCIYSTLRSGKMFTAVVSRPRRLPDCRSPESIPPIPAGGQTFFSEISERFFLTPSLGSRLERLKQPRPMVYSK